MKSIRYTAWLLCLFLLLATVPVQGAQSSSIQELVDETAAYQLSTISFEHGCEWAVMALARGGCSVPEGAFDRYWLDVKDYVQQHEGTFRNYTEYARLTLAITAIGRDPTNVGGYDLLGPICDYGEMGSVPINGAIWALLAMDSGNYCPDDPVRQKYVDLLLSRQLADGGFSLVGKGGSDSPADTDITAMTLQALAGYQDQPAVAAAIERALDCLSLKQLSDGGFDTMGIATSESSAQVLVALGELGLTPEDSRFVKNGKTPLDALLAFRQADGSFVHVAGEPGMGSIATDQAFYALVETLRISKGMSSMYKMSDVEKASSEPEDPGMPGRHGDVRMTEVTRPGISFRDIQGSPCQTAVEALAAREIINGMTTESFDPDATMTRAQYAAIIVRALGLQPDPGSSAGFSDVPANSWFAPFVGAASKYGIVEGRGDGVFDPQGTINRQEAAVMTARAAKLCGMDTSLPADGIRQYIAEFSDYVQVSKWARESMAFCFKAGILVSSEFEADIEPTLAIRRGEVALMVYRLLVKAALI
jgi:hypothetical protein